MYVHALYVVLVYVVMDYLDISNTMRSRAVFIVRAPVAGIIWLYL